MTETKAPKLPKWWVSFDAFGVEWTSVKKPDNAVEAIGPIHRYALVQKPKVCKCVEPFSGPLCLYCANCGGKVKR